MPTSPARKKPSSKPCEVSRKNGGAIVIRIQCSTVEVQAQSLTDALRQCHHYGAWRSATLDALHCRVPKGKDIVGCLLTRRCLGSDDAVPGSLCRSSGVVDISRFKIEVPLCGLLLSTSRTSHLGALGAALFSERTAHYSQIEQSVRRGERWSVDNGGHDAARN